LGVQAYAAVRGTTAGGISTLSCEGIQISQMANRTALQTFGRSGNPMFKSNAFQLDATFDGTDGTQRMTLVWLYLEILRLLAKLRNR